MVLATAAGHVARRKSCETNLGTNFLVDVLTYGPYSSRLYASE